MRSRRLPWSGLGHTTGVYSSETHVDTTNASNHLGDDDHVSKVGLDSGGLLVGESLLLGLPELLDQTKRLPLESSLEPSPGSGVNEL